MKVLVINPGATSTKVAVFDEETQVYKTTVDHSPQELDRFDRVIDQADYRQQAILDAVAQSGFRLSDFDAVCGRGHLLLHPCAGGGGEALRRDCHYRQGTSGCAGDAGGAAIG